MDKAELRSKARTLEPIMHIGKDGITPQVIDEIKRQLRQKRLIKIKMLQSFSEKSDKKAVAQQLADETGSILIDRVGFVVVLAIKSQVTD